MTTDKNRIDALTPLFMPKSVAIVGASNTKTKFGGRYLDSLIKFGYKGKIFPVNPKEGIVQGLAAYPAVDDIPEKVDLAVVATPGKYVFDAIKACARKGIKGVQILSSGFKESGDAGADLESRLAAVAQDNNMRVVGPNCFGTYCPAGGLTIMPGADFPKEPGPVGFISQSGGGACDTINMGKGRGIRFSVLVSYGNGSDLDVVDLLRYFEKDPNTKVVGAYLEGVSNGEAFLHALKSCAEKKPVVIYKGGLTEQGQRGTIGHTGSMAGSKITWEGAMKSAGAVMANDIKDLTECLMVFQCLDGFTGKGCGVLAGGGLRCVEALDAASDFGFTIPVIDEQTNAKMRSLLPPSGGVPGNPVDLAAPTMPPAVVVPLMEMLAEKEGIDFLVLYQMMMYILNNPVVKYKIDSGSDSDFKDYHKAFVLAAEQIRNKTGKPMAIVMPEIASDPQFAETEKKRMEIREYYTLNGIPCFESGRRAFSVLSRVVRYYRRRNVLNAS